MKNRVYLGDCLRLMNKIPNQSVDLILTDPPYGTKPGEYTANHWDNDFDLSSLWHQYRRILKPDGVAAIFSSQPFTSRLVASNHKMFKYCWYWRKNRVTNFFHAKHSPLRRIEEICIFSRHSKYFPQVTYGHEPTKAVTGNWKGKCYNVINKYDRENKVYSKEGGRTFRYPDNILEFDCISKKERLHSSQKPVSLFQYLIKTYTQAGGIVLDTFAGSGTTAIACLNTNRCYILMEKYREYYDIINQRLYDYFV